MIVHIKMNLPSLANARHHWSLLAKIKRNQMAQVAVALRDKELPPMPVVVTLSRIGSRLLDGDNLQSAFKAVRDAVAKECGVDDGSDQYTWRYKQWRGRPKEDYGVDIEITHRVDDE